jgi:hypothetical protein
MFSKRNLFALSALTLASLAATSAMAETITFNTTGQFVSQNGGSITPTSSVSDPIGTGPGAGTATLSFAGLNGASVSTESTSNISFGEFTLTIVTPPAAPASYPSSVSTANLDYGFQLTVNQLTPSPIVNNVPNPPTLLGNLHGTVTYLFNADQTSGSSTSLHLTFDNDAAITFYTANTAVTYYVDNVRLAAPTTNNGITSVQGYLEFTRTSPGTPVPTPAALSGGTALLGLLGAARHKKRRANLA